MRILYHDFAKAGKGISDSDYKTVIEQVAGTSYDDIYSHFLHGNVDYTKNLKDAMAYIGCKLKVEMNKNYGQGALGIKVRKENNVCIVDNLFPSGVAEELGLSINDEIVAVNGIKLNGDFDHWVNYFSDEDIALSIKKELGGIYKLTFPKGKTGDGFKDYEIVKENENENFTHWFNQ